MTSEKGDRTIFKLLTQMLLQYFNSDKNSLLPYLPMAPFFQPLTSAIQNQALSFLWKVRTFQLIISFQSFQGKRYQYKY
jgi:hypothetical protein